MSFSASDVRSYITNVRLNVFDQNTEATRVILSDVHDTSGHAIRTSITGPVSISGAVSVTGTVATNISGQTVNVGNFPAVQSVTGSVNVGNFPAVQSITGTVATNISGQTVNVGNFPATQGVTGSVSVSNFPAVQTVSVSGPVSVTGTVTTDVSGQTINVGNFPAIQTVSVSGPVSVTGTVATNISGQSVVVSNFPATQSVTGSVSVSNFPAVQTVSVSGPVSTDISGQTVNVGNFPAVQTVSVSGPVSVTGTVATDISGQSVVVSNFPATQSVTGSVSVSNFPAVQTVSVSGIVDVSGSFTANISGQTVNVGNIVGVTGTVALATGTQVSLSGATFDATRLTVYDASLNSRFSNLSYTGTLLNVYDSTTETKLTATNSLLTTIEADISGGVISKGVDDVGVAYPMYTDANGIQRVEVVQGEIQSSKYIFETDASIIASSSGAGWAIDVRARPGWYYDAVAVSTLKWYGNNTISTPPSLEFIKAQAIYMIAAIDVTALLPRIRVITSASVWDYDLPAAANIINGESYLFYYGNKAITLNPSVYPLLMTRTLISGPGANNEIISEINVVTSTNGTNGSKFLLQATGIWNQTLLQQFQTVFENVRAFTAETKLGNLTYTGTKLQTIDASANATLTTIDTKIPSGLTVASSKLQTIDGSANATLTTIDTTLTSLNNKVPSGLGVSTVNSISCLNVNPVKPQTLQYAIGGVDGINSAYRLIGGNPTATGNQVDTFNFSTANARVYYATTSTGTANTNLFIDYVDAAGGLVLNAGPYGLVALSFTALPSMISILALRTSTNFNTVANNNQLYISPATNTTTSMYHISIANYGVSVATVPAGYYGYISTLTASFESAASLIVVKWSTGGIRSPIYKLNLPAGGTTTVSSGESGYIGGILSAGESVGFTNNIAIVGKLVQATLTLVAI